MTFGRIQTGGTPMKVEHPDLDEVYNGYTLRRIVPTYIDKTELVDEVDFHCIERVDPPKGVANNGQEAHKVLDI